MYNAHKTCQTLIGNIDLDICYFIEPAEPADREYPGAPAYVQITNVEWHYAGIPLSNDEFDKHEAQLIEACEQHVEELTQ